MAIEQEDGTGKSNANSYATIAQFKDYANGRRLTIPSTNSELEALLLRGMDAMLGLDYLGERATKAQALDWPRTGVMVDGFSYASTEIPKQLIDGQCALAAEAHTTDLLPTIPANASGGIISETVGDISIQYADSGRASTRPIVEKAKAHLRKLLRNGGAGLRVVRS